MKIKCRYCDSLIQDTYDNCPNCGGINRDKVVEPASAPRTIQELKDFCERKGLPLEKMRFFIGVDYKKPKAFGIFENNGYFTVYKNKANGERAIRYEGYDEAYAVNEIFEKLKSEIDLRRGKKKKDGTVLDVFTRVMLLVWALGMIIIPIVIFIQVQLRRIHADDFKIGYYYDYTDYYYYSGDFWYEYDYLYDTWEYVEDYDFYVDEYYKMPYKTAVDELGDSVYPDAVNTDRWYTDWDNDDYGYDWGSSSDYDSWDFNDTDWDSDW